MKKKKPNINPIRKEAEIRRKFAEICDAARIVAVRRADGEIEIIKNTTEYEIEK